MLGSKALATDSLPSSFAKASAILLANGVTWIPDCRPPNPAEPAAITVAGAECNKELNHVNDGQ